jgi:hypothetical protein|tara:strand:+ start:1194 stop:1631 length:438 start_codon:yes stop_codon:yes gene_type:complete
MAYNGLLIGKALFDIISRNTNLNVPTLLNNDSSLIQPAPMRSEADPVLGITYEIDSIDNINIKRDYNSLVPVNLVSTRLDVFAKDYGTGAELARVLVEELTTTRTPDSYNGVTIQGINIDNVKQDFNTKSRRYVWTVFVDLRVYN